DALNITRDAEGEAQDKFVSNILGNSLINYVLPDGINKVIGFYADKLRNRAYYFIWNSEGYNSIVFLNADDNQVVKVLESKTDSDGQDNLKFNPSYKVLSVNLIHRDEGDLLFFNDSFNEPRVINVDADFGNNWKEEYLSVAKAPPIMPLKPVYENDYGDTLVTNELLSLNNSCRTWTIYSNCNVGDGGTVEYYDCSGNYQTISVGECESKTFNAKGNPLQISGVGVNLNMDSIYMLNGNTDTKIPFSGFSTFNSFFSKNVGNDEFTYIYAYPETLNFTVNFSFNYNFSGSNATIGVYKNGILVSGSSDNLISGIGNFNYSKTLSISLTASDILTFRVTRATAVNTPEYINLTSSVVIGTLNAATNNKRVSVNNLRNKLFQFRYRFVYDDFVKSVWSSASIVPLPNQPSGKLTYDLNFTDNSRLRLFFSTGNEQTKTIELAFRDFSDNFTSGWKLITSINIEELSIEDND
ncbi:MAG: hypothetical protein ACR2HS_06970, partial [Gammaproteobacteria bacterium]